MDLEQLKQRRDKLIKDNEWADGLIKKKEEELWEVKVRTIAASELARSALESALRSVGIVDTFYGPDKQKERKRNRMNTLPQKQFKRMKRKVEEETARGIGYFEGILEHIPSYPLSEAVKELALSGWITSHTDVIDVQNMIVTESIKWMNYQDFKEVAPIYFHILESNETKIYWFDQ